jgi:hypothetical protein
MNQMCQVPPTIPTLNKSNQKSTSKLTCSGISTTFQEDVAWLSVSLILALHETPVYSRYSFKAPASYAANKIEKKTSHIISPKLLILSNVYDRKC